MNGQVWKRYVTNMCRDAWDLDRGATAELVTCIEELINAHDSSPAGVVQVFLGVGTPAPGRRARSFQIEIRPGRAR